MQAALLIRREKQRLKGGKRVNFRELPSNLATRLIPPLPRYPPKSYAYGVSILPSNLQSKRNSFQEFDPRLPSRTFQYVIRFVWDLFLSQLIFSFFQIKFFFFIPPGIFYFYFKTKSEDFFNWQQKKIYCVVCTVFFLFLHCCCVIESEAS